MTTKEKSVRGADPAVAFYRPAHPPEPASEAGEDVFEASSATPGPWSTAAQHGGPPGALLTRAIEALEPGVERVIGRITMDLLGPVPVGRIGVAAEVLRPGRTVSLRGATLTDVEAGRAVARAQAWTFPIGGGPGKSGPPLEHSPADGVERPTPPGWLPGYLDAIEWRWIDGGLGTAGTAVVWMRPRLPLLEGEPLTGVQRLMLCVDSASGASSVLDPREHTFMNTELSVHVLRPPVGDWLCLTAETTLGPGRVAVARSTVHDLDGVLATSAQALLVAPVDRRAGRPATD